jgi:hypothetical protein
MMRSLQEEIVQLLSAGPFADNVVSVKPEVGDCDALLKQRDAVGTGDLAQVNNTWFVKFNVDDGAQDVVLWLRSQTFKVSC